MNKSAIVIVTAFALIAAIAAYTYVPRSQAQPQVEVPPFIVDLCMTSREGSFPKNMYVRAWRSGDLEWYMGNVTGFEWFPVPEQYTRQAVVLAVDAANEQPSNLIRVTRLWSDGYVDACGFNANNVWTDWFAVD